MRTTFRVDYRDSTTEKDVFVALTRAACDEIVPTTSIAAAVVVNDDGASYIGIFITDTWTYYPIAQQSLTALTGRVSALETLMQSLKKPYFVDLQSDLASVDPGELIEGRIFVVRQSQASTGVNHLGYPAAVNNPLVTIPTSETLPITLMRKGNGQIYRSFYMYFEKEFILLNSEGIFSELAMVILTRQLMQDNGLLNFSGITSKQLVATINALITSFNSLSVEEDPLDITDVGCIEEVPAGAVYRIPEGYVLQSCGSMLEISGDLHIYGDLIVN